MNLRRPCAHPAPVFETIAAPGPWISRAACANEPTDLFFPEDGEGTELAKAICGGCPVRAECIGYAVAIPSLDGIWGGLTERERERLRRERYGSVDVDDKRLYANEWGERALIRAVGGASHLTPPV